MADTQFTTEPLAGEPTYQVFQEPTHRPASYLAWESSADYCRKVVRVSNVGGANPILPGTIITDEDDDFVGILFGRPLSPGVEEDRTVTHQGPCIVLRDKLIFPVVTDAADGADAGSDNAAENAAATAALKTTLVAAMKAAGIDIQ